MRRRNSRARTSSAGWAPRPAAGYLGITTRTLYAFIDEGQVPAYTFGRVIRLKRPDLDAFIEASRVEPGTLGHLRNPSKDS